jgi:hypothetical protein
MEDRHPVQIAADHRMHLVAPFGRVYWDIRQRYIHAEWTMYFEGEALRGAYETVLDAIAEHKARRLLTDSRHRGLISVADQRWMDETWMPRFLSSGVTRVAFVLPAGPIGRMSITNATKRLPGSQVTAAVMDSVAEAVAWLITDEGPRT